MKNAASDADAIFLFFSSFSSMQMFKSLLARHVTSRNGSVEERNRDRDKDGDIERTIRHFHLSAVWPLSQQAVAMLK